MLAAASANSTGDDLFSSPQRAKQYLRCPSKVSTGSGLHSAKTTTRTAAARRNEASRKPRGASVATMTNAKTSAPSCVKAKMSFVFYPIKISFHETLVQVIPLGNILAIDLYPSKTTPFI